MTQPHINQLREHLMQTLADLRNKDNPMEPDRARAIAQVAGVLVDTARVEVDFLRVTDKTESAFIEGDAERITDQPALAHNPFNVVRHKLAG